ncbi:MAG TPA: PSD1 and planctomycete cytochrome C domain-containing protein [Pirellulales bacterium]|nr:PSD1 and planctomycete cytochrome C domain-containing protein [Pirellulales bacterium]
MRNAFVALAIVAVPRALFGADGVTPASGTAATEATAAPTFEVDIRPILRTHCFDCHGANDEKQGNLDLRLVRFQLAGGDSGPAIAPGDPDHSHLLARIRAGEMPPGEGKVTAKEIDTIARWIAGGAKTARPEPESIPPGVGISVEERSWWAFQPLARPAVPESQPADPRVRGPIDALLKAAMPSGLSFAADADKRVLIRRASFDLLGLPPQPDEVEAFVADQSPDAYERLLDRLLASPHYGERWARHWLDAAGYADSEGATVQDAIRTWSYKYRDYVIRSLNADKPFDRFIHEQLAGDELAGPISGDMTAEQIELLTATGFLRMAADGTGSGDNSPEARNQVVTDTLKIVTSSLLGVSVACAQCHDHRYDPVPQTDYYALRAVFEPALDYQAWKVPAERDVSLYTAADRQKAADIEAEAQKIAAERAPKEAAFMTEAVEKELMKFEEPLRSELRTAYNTAADKRSDAQKQLLDKHPSVNITPGVLYQYNQAAADELKKFDERMANVRSGKPPQEFLRALVEPAAHTPETRLFYRGDYRQPKQSIGPGALSVCGPDSRRAEFASKSDSLPSSGRRLALARWLTGADNPLTARVLANRVWLHHFGRGIVTTPGDFGRLGTLPTHPALLDWLAVEFRESGWSLKKLHKTIMLSTAYRQSSRRDTAQAALDSDNRYYGRQNVVRLDAEALRDRVLAANGKLDRTLFGAPVAIKEDDAGQVILAGDVQRRSLYAMQRRSQPVALMQAFDAPAMQTNCEARASSTVATQSLMLMNGDFWLTQAGALAERAQREPTADLQAELVAGLTPRWLAGPPTWQFGYGACDTASGRTTFTALPHWTNSSWQGGEKLPDEKTGWVLVHADGGHPGANPDHAAIRRWTAPVGGVLTVQGTLGHSSENGDGVRGRVVSSTLGIAGEWSVRHGEAATNVERIVVARGDAIDFVTDCVGDVNADSFTWRVTLSLAQEGGETATFASHEGFHGPPSQSEAGVELASVVRAWQLAYLRLPTRDELSAACAFLDAQINYLRLHPGNAAAGRSPETQALANLCQALVSSNEFLYVD